MILEDLATQFVDVRGTDREAVERVIAKARSHLRNATKLDWDALANALLDVDRKWFVAAIFSKTPVPERLFKPMIQASVYELNPSLNRQLVLPCVASQGHRRVNEALLDVFERGTDFEKAGACQSLYWAGMHLSFPPNTKEFTPANATPECQMKYFALNDIWTRKRRLYLAEFVSNKNVAVLRSIIPSLNLEAAQYPEDLRPLVARAIEIARGHDDDYIRHRVEVQLGNEPFYHPLPSREQEQ